MLSILVMYFFPPQERHLTLHGIVGFYVIYCFQLAPHLSVKLRWNDFREIPLLCKHLNKHVGCNVRPVLALSCPETYFVFPLKIFV